MKQLVILAGSLLLTALLSLGACNHQTSAGSRETKVSSPTRPAPTRTGPTAEQVSYVVFMFEDDIDYEPPLNTYTEKDKGRIKSLLAALEANRAELSVRVKGDISVTVTLRGKDGKTLVHAPLGTWATRPFTSEFKAILKRASSLARRK